MLNTIGGEKKEQPRPVTLPKLALIDIDIEQEARDAAARIIEQRTIRLGREAWSLTEKAASFENYKAIGRALQIGRGIATRATGASTGKHYTKTFYAWADRHGFTGMSKEARWSAVDLVEHLAEVEHWRSMRSDKERQRLIHPLSNLRAWRRSQTPKVKPDALAKAETAWRHFVSCVEALPPDQAAPFWCNVKERAALALR